MILELLPLFVFLFAYRWKGLACATIVLLVTSSIAATVQHYRYRQFTSSKRLGLILIWICGIGSLCFNDPRFLQWKPSILYAILGSFLLSSCRNPQTVLQKLMGKELQIPGPAWRILTWSWGAFFWICAIANFWLMQTIPFSTWVLVKTVGIPAITCLFALISMGVIYLNGYQVIQEKSKSPSGGSK